jgi:hypothetical protein
MPDLNRLDIEAFTDLAMASRLGSAVRLDDIPVKYKKLPVLGRGTTTIALDNGDTVLLLTRDYIKAEWLERCKIADRLERYESGSHIHGMRELAIYIERVPKLFKLNLENRRLAVKAIKEFEEVKSKAMHGYYVVAYGKRDPHEYVFDELRKYFTKDEDHILAPLFNFLADYDAKTFYFDLGIRNFMQDADGKLVVSDPIVLAEIVDLIHADHRKTADMKLSAQRGW